MNIVFGWVALGIGALILVAANPMIGAGVAMVMYGLLLLADV